MKAAVVEKLGVVNVKDVEDPQLLDESILVKVEACAVCGSDIRIFRKGDARAKLPRIIGHEIAGVIQKVGAKAYGFQEGERVTIAPGHGCGVCKYCQNGMANVCINPQPSIGYASSGGFAQYIVPPVNVVKNGFVNRIPDNISFEQASMSELLACCINAQERAGIKQGDVVVIIGAGPAGCMHVGLARLKGASKIILTQRSKERLLIAKEKFKPDEIIAADGEELVQSVLELTDGIGADVVIVAAPAPSAQETAFNMIAPRGRINFFGGLPKNNSHITIDANIIHYKEIYVSGASSSLGRQNAEALQLISTGDLNAEEYITHRFSLDEIDDAFDVVENKQSIKTVVFPWK